MKTLFFHVGAHKTGSSFLQNTFVCNRELLESHGLGYLHKYTLAKSKYFGHLMNIWGKDVDQEVPYDQAHADFQGLVADYDQPNILLSHENFLGSALHKDPRMYPFAEQILAAIMKMAGGHRVRILLCVRNQGDFVESYFIQRAMKGKPLNFADYFASLGYSHLSWYGLAVRIRDIVGAENLLIMPFEFIYEGNESFVRRFLRLCGLEVEEALALSDERNPSFSDAALKISALAAPHLRLKERKLLKVFLQKHVSSANYERARLLEEPERVKLMRHFSDENQSLFKDFMEPDLVSPAIMSRYLGV